MGVNLRAWHGWGRPRTYVNDDEGNSLGYRDEQTGEVHVTVADRADDVRRALESSTAPPTADPEHHLRRRAALAAGRSQRALRQPFLSERALAAELELSSPFRWDREHPWNGGQYRLDFYCAAARLAVEVDGPSHRTRVEYDAERDRYFRAQGVETLRVTRDEVLRDCGAVVARINWLCMERAKDAPSHSERRTRGSAFVCAGCRQECRTADRSLTTASRCTRCAP